MRDVRHINSLRLGEKVTYGSLTVIRRAKPQSGSSCDWVKCNCGSRKFTVRTSALKAGKVTRCKSKIHELRGY